MDVKTFLLISALVWDPNVEPDLAGYKVYYSENDPAMDQLVHVVDVGRVERFEIRSQHERKTFRVTAYDTAGNESDFSSPVRVESISDSSVAMPVFKHPTKDSTVVQKGDTLSFSVRGVNSVGGEKVLGVDLKYQLWYSDTLNTWKPFTPPLNYGGRDEVSITLPKGKWIRVVAIQVYKGIDSPPTQSKYIFVDLEVLDGEVIIRFL